MKLLPLGCFISLITIQIVTSLDVTNERFASVRHLPTEKSVNTLTSRSYRPLFYWDDSLQTTTLPAQNTTKFRKTFRSDDKKKMKRRRRNKRRQKLSRKRVMFGDDEIDRQKQKHKRVNRKKKMKKVEEENELNLVENQLEVMLNNLDDQQYYRTGNNDCDCEHYCDKITKTCGCYEGFFLTRDGKTCKDIDECEVNNGGCDHICHNIIGRRTCSCHRGWRLHNSTRCLDINECSLNNGHGWCSHKCINTKGSFKCSCENLPGTQLGPDKRRCLLNNHLLADCRSLGGCSHTCIIARAGTSVYCTCPDGWQLGADWKTCLEPPPAQLILPPTNTSTTPFPDLSDVYIPDHVVCPPLFPPRHGFIECFREKSAPRPTAPSGRKRLLNRPGSVCQLYCPVGYRKDGKWKRICGVDGKWEGDDDGKCIQYAPPTIKCSGPIISRLKPGQRAIEVTVPSPASDLEPKHIRSEPKLIDDTITLPRGQHWVHFTATHPITRKSSECTTHIVVKGPPTI